MDLDLGPVRAVDSPTDLDRERKVRHLRSDRGKQTALERAWVGIPVEGETVNLVVAPPADGCLHDSARNHLPVRVNSGSTRFLGAQQDQHRT